MLTAADLSSIPDPRVRSMVQDLAGYQQANAGQWGALSNNMLGRLSGMSDPGSQTDAMAPRLNTMAGANRGRVSATPAGAGPTTQQPAASLRQAPRLARDHSRENPDYVNVHDDLEFVNPSGRQVPFRQLRSDLERQHGGDQTKVEADLRREYGVVPTADATGARNGWAIHSQRLTPESRDQVGALRAAANNPPGADFAMRNGAFGILPDMSMRGLGSLGGGLGLLSMGSAMLGATDGIQFQLRKQMRSVASNFGDYSMISLINSPGISIESLIYYFMAYMSDKYEDKLREKMEEIVIQEQRERRMQQRRDAAEMIGGILSIGGVFNPVGTAAGMVVKQGAEMINSVEGALAGGSKSTTVLMQEVQILIQNWKMIMDMHSNVSKTLHEMAMTAVRNIR